MREAERKRLVKLIQDSVDGCAENWARVIADYLLENGVIVPPCKVGDTVYRIYTNSWIGEDKVSYFVIRERGLRYCDDKGRETSCDNFGKLVFLTEAEAKYALKNRRSVSLVDGHIEE